MKNKLIFIIILVLAFLLRFWQLDNFPSSLNWDEVSHGYNAYSLIKSGQDQWSKSWPIFNFRAYGDYPTTLNMYLSIPFIYMFGLNNWTTRIVSALCGFGLVIVSYFLGQEIFKNKNKSLFLMFLVSISPWTFFPSRAVFQSTVAQLFFSLGCLFLIKTIKKIKYLPLGVLFLSLSTYAYHNTKIVVPILIIVFFAIFLTKIKKNIITNKKILIISLLILLVLMIPQIINTLNKDAQARSRWVFAINPNTINIIENNRNNYLGNPLIAKLKYNRLTTLTQVVIKNYLGFINPKILFFNSTQNYQFNIPNTGVLYSICLPFFYFGLFILIIKSIKFLPFFKGRCPKDGGVSLFLILWFFIGLAPAVITVGDFPIIRAMTILPLPQIFITIGLFKSLFIFKNKNIKNLILIIYISVLSYQSIVYLKNYFYDYQVKYSSSWQYGYKQVVDYVKTNYHNYDQIIFTKKYGEPHEYILFYWPWDPISYLTDSNLDWDYHADWYWVNSFDKFKFVNDWEIKQTTQNIAKNQKVLLITSPNNYNQGNQLIKTVNFLDNTPAFQILEIK